MKNFIEFLNENKAKLEKGVNYVLYSDFKDMKYLFDKTAAVMGQNIQKYAGKEERFPDVQAALKQQGALAAKGESSIIASIFIDNVGSMRFNDFNVVVFGIDNKKDDNKNQSTSNQGDDGDYEDEA